MGDIETVKIKSGNGDYAIINKSDYDPKQHKLFDADSKAAVAGYDNLTEEERAELDRLLAKRKVEANRGVPGLGNFDTDPDRNPSGTYSTPTPTDIRYPDKLATEFENNMGAFVDKSAADLREEKNLPDAPGGLRPQVDIPDDWNALNWREQVKLAETISGRDDLNAAGAREVIQAEVDRRKV